LLEAGALEKTPVEQILSPEIVESKQRPVSFLIVLCGPDPYAQIERKGEGYLYKINSALDTPRGLVEINDPFRLNRIADEVRGEYLQWIEKIEKDYEEIPRGFLNVSVATFSDLSCKRTELFQTFDTVCNLLLIREKLADIFIEDVYVVNGDLNLIQVLASEFPRSVIHSVNQTINSSRIRGVLSDVRFLFRCLAAMVLSRLVWNAEPIEKHSGRGFFSIVPKMVDSQGKDRKYGDRFGRGDIVFASVLTDGFHQNLSIRSYLKSILTLHRQKQNTLLIDRYVSMRGLLKGIVLRLELIVWMNRWRSRKYIFQKLDMTGYIKYEKLISHRRLWRLAIFSEAFAQAVNVVALRQFTYYLFEYPIGRVTSMVISQQSPETKRIGFQHGPASWRKLVYFLGPVFASRFRGQLERPLPHYIYAENTTSADIYRAAGYDQIRVMDLCPRLHYLSTISRENITADRLIAPGLNDGKAMISLLMPEIQSNQTARYLVRTHPLANNSYLSPFLETKNLVSTNKSLPELLSTVEIVYVTYSSVGLEAAELGIEVVVVDIPGKVSQSPLHDVQKGNPHLD